MIIDFHTHTFPSSVAEKAVDKLKASSGYDNYSDGSAEGLLKSMAKSRIGVSVNMPILTNPDNFEKTLYHLIEQRDRTPDIISFAAIHPRCTGLAGKIKTIAAAGFKGIKIHPFFQDEPLDSDKTAELVSLAEESGLFITIHPGKDASFPDSDIADVCRIERLLDVTGAKKVILAHMGAMEMWKESYERLAGRDVYFDTSFSLDVMGRDLFLKTVKKHSPDRILFGTDSPWRDQKIYVDILKNESGLSNEDKEKIFYKNAVKILGLKVKNDK